MSWERIDQRREESRRKFKYEEMKGVIECYNRFNARRGHELNDTLTV